MTSDAPFSLRVEGEEEALRCIPGQWLAQLHRPGARTEITICLKTNSDLNDIRFPNGWSISPVSGMPQAVFAPNGRASFALAYEGADEAVTVSVRKALDGFVRPGILYGLLIALRGQCVGLHGVTLQCDGQTVILSAPSGTGKSTLAGLLEETGAARIINGDFALLSVAEEGVWYEPTPFCGTSGISLNERVQVDRIVFLTQAVQNSWRSLSAREAMVRLFSNAFVPAFDARAMENVQDNILQMMCRLKLSDFAFAPTKEAADLFRTCLPGGNLPTKKL